ncbi:Craniofacial development protein 2 [Blattella germanica]|nr:Craniofacial development protein 2 [Blattella germanica]PSN35185.1 Craniofacial development protein 2 [Blattella germanica]PSN35186.1 Craniofacial development protein 2 [Blattella germanica]
MAFEFGTWNVKSLYKTGTLLTVLEQINKYNLPVTAVQETRWHGDGINEVKGYTIMYSGKKEGTQEYGTAFIVSKNLKVKI